MSPRPIAWLGLAALLAAAWWSWGHGGAPTANLPGAPADGGMAQRVTLDQAPSPLPSAADERVAETDREVAIVGAWTLQLTGIDPARPWTSPLDLEFSPDLRLTVAVDPTGTCRFVPPAAARLPGFQVAHMREQEPHYRIADPALLLRTLQASGTSAIAVFPVARLQGRVLGPDGDGVVARVGVFATGAAGPRAPMLAGTRSAPDGRYTLEVPPATPLLLLAEAVHVDTGWSFLEPELPVVEPATTFLGAPGMADGSSVRDDMLPAVAAVQASHGSPGWVPDLRLGAPAVLTGRVVGADGRPFGNVEVTARPESATPVPWRRLHWWSPTEGVVRGARTRSDANGAFAASLRAGVAFAVGIDVAAVVATAPGHVELLVPGARAVVRVVADGRPVPLAAVDVDGEVRTADAAGELHLAVGRPGLRVRGRDDTRASDWAELPVAGGTVELELRADRTAPVRVALPGAIAQLAGTLHWQPWSPGPTLSVPWPRERSGPVVTQLPIGRYRLVVDGAFFTAAPLEVEVPPGGVTVTHAVAVGGRLAIDLRDRAGMPLAGTFVLRDDRGLEVHAATQVVDEQRLVHVGAIGELQALGRNELATVLSPGDYALEIAVAGRARLQRQLRIQAGGVTSMVVEVP